MGNQEENQKASDPLVDLIVGSFMGDIIKWFAFLIPPLLLYWLSAVYGPSYLYSAYETFSLCGVGWLIFIVVFVLFIYVQLVIISARILSRIGKHLTMDSISIRIAILAEKIRVPITKLLWIFVIILAYSLVNEYAPLRPIIMKTYSLFHILNFIDYYQITYLCNSYVSWAIDFVTR